MAHDVCRAMGGYFARLTTAWRESNGSLPKVPWQEDVDQWIYVSRPDEAEWVEWEPVNKDVPSDLAPIESQLGTSLHPSVKEYVNCFWFCSLGGTFRSRAIQLDPVLPGISPADFEDRVLGYCRVHGGRLRHVPIGLEADRGLLLVVDNSTGEIMVEDAEVGELQVLAGGLAELISGLEV